MNVVRPVHGDNGYLYPKALDFSSNINPMGPSRAVLRALEESLPKISGYPSRGENLKEEISRLHGLKEEVVTLGNGSSELIKNFCEFAFGKGDRVLIASPTFSEYEYFSRLNGAKLSFFNLPERQDFDAGKLCGKSYKAIFLCHPNNPTSHHFKNLEELLEDGSATVFLDEAYIEFSGLESYAGLVEGYSNLLVVHSLTKFYSLAGLRLGYCLSSREIAEGIAKVQPPWNVNSLALEAGLAALQDWSFKQDSKKFFRSERDFLSRKLSGLETIKAGQAIANFFLLDMGMPSSESWQRLLDRGILVRDCSSFGLESHIRVCLRERDENIKLIEALEEIDAGRSEG